MRQVGEPIHPSEIEDKGREPIGSLKILGHEAEAVSRVMGRIPDEMEKLKAKLKEDPSVLEDPESYYEAGASFYLAKLILKLER